MGCRCRRFGNRGGGGAFGHGGVLDGGHDFELEVGRRFDGWRRQGEALGYRGEFGDFAPALLARLQVLLKGSHVVGVQGSEGPSGDFRMFQSVPCVIHHGNLARSERCGVPAFHGRTGFDRAEGDIEPLGDLALGEAVLLA